MTLPNEHYSLSSPLGSKSRAYTSATVEENQHQKQMDSYFSKQMAGLGTGSRPSPGPFQNLMLGGYRQTSALKPNVNSASAANLPRGENTFTYRSDTKIAVTLRPSSSHKDLLPSSYTASARSPSGQLSSDYLQNRTTNLQQSQGAYFRPGHSIPYSSYQANKSGSNEASRYEPGSSIGGYHGHKLQSGAQILNQATFGNYLTSNTPKIWSQSPQLASKQQTSRHSSMLALMPPNYQADRGQMERSASGRPHVIISPEEQTALMKLCDYLESQKQLDTQTYNSHKRKILSELKQPARLAEQELERVEEQNRELDSKIVSLASQLKELEAHFAEVGEYFNPEFTLGRLAAPELSKR